MDLTKAGSVKLLNFCLNAIFVILTPVSHFDVS